MASILTGDDGPHGFGGMNHRQPGADLARQMDDAANRVVTIGDNGHTSRVDDRARDRNGSWTANPRSDDRSNAGAGAQRTGRPDRDQAAARW